MKKPMVVSDRHDDWTVLVCKLSLGGTSIWMVSVLVSYTRENCGNKNFLEKSLLLAGSSPLSSLSTVMCYLWDFGPKNTLFLEHNWPVSDSVLDVHLVPNPHMTLVRRFIRGQGPDVTL